MARSHLAGVQDGGVGLDERALGLVIVLQHFRRRHPRLHRHALQTLSALVGPPTALRRSEAYGTSLSGAFLCCRHTGMFLQLDSHKSLLHACAIQPQACGNGMLPAVDPDTNHGFRTLTTSTVHTESLFGSDPSVCAWHQLPTLVPVQEGHIALDYSPLCVDVRVAPTRSDRYSFCRRLYLKSSTCSPHLCGCTAIKSR